MDQSDRRIPSRATRADSAQSARRPLTDERVAALRLWVARGCYNTPEVMEAVAKQLLRSGDVER